MSPARVGRVCLALGLLALGVEARVFGGESQHQPFGYTRPFQTAEVAAAEPEVISEIAVKEGQTVAKGDVLAGQDLGTLPAELELAVAAAKCTGRLEVAKAELALQELRLKRLTDVQDKSYVREDEIARVKADVEIGKANVKAAQEAVTLKEMEIKRVQAQIDRRVIRSPFAGVVTEIHRQAGESTVGQNGKVFTVVQLDKLKATIHLPEAQAQPLSAGSRVRLELGEGKNAVAVDGTVLYVSPLNDAASNTVRVDFVIDNPSGRFRGGCRVALAEDKLPAPTTAAAPSGKRIDGEGDAASPTSSRPAGGTPPGNAAPRPQ